MFKMEPTSGSNDDSRDREAKKYYQPDIVRD